MANVQTYFEQFHATIRMDYEMSETLRDKRDKLLRRIRTYLADNDLPGFDELLQGSYKMKTGVVPIVGLEYDIDVGLRFGFSEDEYSPTTVRSWVFSAVEDHTNKVESKGPCIRVTYADGYHVDLVTYACWENILGQVQFRLAHKTNGWRPADPVKLHEYVKNARQPFAGTEDNTTKTDQFRRVVRYLRRWNDVAIPRESKSKPTGLAFVLLVAQQLLYSRMRWDGQPDDRRALEDLATLAANTVGRLVAQKPTPEYEDMFARLSDDDMEELKERFRTMAAALRAAETEVDPVEACRILSQVFGDDFPVPKPEDTASRTIAPAIVTSSSSA